MINKITKNILLLASSIIFIIGCTSQDNKNEQSLEGAFGIRFGDVFDSNQTSEQIMRNNRPVFEINPPKKIQYFDKYYIAITPKTHRIYSIYAEKAYHDFLECIDSREAVLGILYKKYGNWKSDDKGEIYTIMANNGFIMFNCDFYYKLKIKYKYLPLFDIAEKEKIDLVKNKNAL